MASTFEALLLAQTNLLLNKPRFKGSILTATALTTGSNINYSTVSEDTYGAWNSTSHYWVVPVAGLYFAAVQFNWGTTAPSTGPAIKILGGASNATAEVQSQNAPSIGSGGGFSTYGFVRANAGDQLSVQLVNSGFTTVSASPADNNFFELFFVSL